MDINIYIDFNINLLKLCLISLYEKEFENFNFFYDTVFDYLYKYYEKNDENIRTKYNELKEKINSDIRIIDDNDKKTINNELLIIINPTDVQLDEHDRNEIKDIIWGNIEDIHISLYRVYYYYYFFIKYFHGDDYNTFECNPLRYYKTYINSYLQKKNIIDYHVDDPRNVFFNILVQELPPPPP